MNVGTISLVGISVVFFTFLVLFLLFKLLAKLFGDKGSKMITTPVITKRKTESTHDNELENLNTELIAAITAAICTYTLNDIRIMSIKEKRTSRGNHWKAQKTKIWRPIRKGVKKAW